MYIKEAIEKNLISAEHVFIDSTHVKASANKRKFEKKVVRKETRAYQERLQEEINQDREEHGKSQSHGVSSIMMDSKRFTILYSGFKSNEKPKKGSE